MGKFIDLTGKKFGRWLVIKRDTSEHKWLCRCECGTERLISTGSLNSGITKSCGCAHKVRGGLSHHTLAPRYRLMLERCYKTSCKQYKDYGGRGIYVCDRWLGKEGLINYIEDISSLPHAKDTGYELDRINNDGPYAPNNVRWVTRSQNLRNYRRNVHVKIDGMQMVAIDAIKLLNIPQKTFYSWIEKFGADVAVEKAKARRK